MKRNVLQKRILSWVLVLALCIGILPATSWASEAQAELLDGPVAKPAMEAIYEENFEREALSEQIEVPEGATATVENGELNYTAEAGKLLYILGGEMWGYYTVEAKITTQSAAPTSVSLGFYVKDETKYLEAALTDLEANTTYQVKVVANGTEAQAYTLDGSTWVALGEAIAVQKGEQSGSVGFAVVPAGDEDTATIVIDDVKVTHNLDAQEAKHTLFAVDFGKYTTATTMTASNTHKNYYIKTSGTGIAVKGQDGKISIEGSGMMYFDLPDAAHWKDYVVEADIEYADDSNGLAGLLYHVQNEESYQAAYLSADGSKAGLKGYWNGAAEANTGNILHEKTGAGVAEGKRRLQVVVKDDMADLYVATYDGDTLGTFEWVMSINDIADHHSDGSIGFLATDSAKYDVDNLEVYEYTTTYSENFDSFEAGALTEGTNGTLGIETYWNDTYQADTNMKVENGQFTISRTSGDSTKYDLAWFTAGQNWTNYTYEADITPTVLTMYGAAWEGLIYRIADSTLWQRVGLSYEGAKIWTVSGAHTSGGFTPNLRTVDNVQSTNQEGWGSNGYLFYENQKLRMKVVVKNNCTWIYYASYDANGNLGPYSLHVVLPIGSSFTGSVGMGATGKYGLSYDNVVVSAVEGDTSKTSLADIYVPDTGIVNPATVVTKVDKSNINDLKETSVAIMYIDENLNVLDENQVETIGSVSQFMKNYGDTIIPAFYIDTEAETAAICTYLKEHGITDAFYVADSSNTELMKKARSQEKDGKTDLSAIGWRFVRGILEYQTMPTDRAQSRRDILNSLASIAIFPTEELTVDIVAEYNIRTISVWSCVKDKADVYEGIANGYNGMIVADSSLITEVYENIQTTTVSGKPVVIGHGGKQGTNANGETLYENTVKAFESAVKEDHVMGIEVDPQVTLDDEVILYHDTTLGGTSIKNMTLEQVREYMQDAGKDLSTLDEAFAFLSENPTIVMYFNAYYNAVYGAKFAELFEQYPNTKDQVVIFSRQPTRGTEPINTTNLTYGWLNEYWGDGLPIVGSTIGETVSRFENISYIANGAPKEEIIQAMINRLAPYNHQQMPYDYDIISTNGDRDSLSYALAARGYLLLQSSVADLSKEQAELDRFYISEMGTVGLLADHTNLTTDYCYQVQAKDATVKIGETLNVAQTVKSMTGAVSGTTGNIKIAKQGVNWIGGDAVVAKNGSYTMNSNGSATVVYYADVEQTRDYGKLAYRIYSEPVTVTWNETGFVCAHEILGEYKYTEDNHYQACEDCGAALNIEPHREAAELVGKTEATANTTGYTGDIVCAVCDYVIDKGSEIPADTFAGYTTITPKDFGIEDDTYKEGKVGANSPLSTFDKVNFVMDFQGTLAHYSGITYLKKDGNTSAGLKIAYHTTEMPGGLLIANWTGLTLCNSNKETLSNNLYIAPSAVFPNGEYDSVINAPIRMNITTDLCALDVDGELNDLKLGFWFNGKLYKNQYYYLADITGLQYQLHIAALEEGVTIQSPLAFVREASPLDGYKLVTPSDFGIADTDSEQVISTSTPNPNNIYPSKYDKTAFVANVRFTPNGWAGMSFLEHNVVGVGLSFIIQNNGSIAFYNYLNNYRNKTLEERYMYAGGKFEHNGTEYVYVSDGREPMAYDGAYTLSASKTNIGSTTFTNQDFTLWLTMDMVDFDHDGDIDDMQIGIWINGQLYDKQYLYIRNCDAGVKDDKDYIREKVKVTALTHISSPIWQLEDIGVIAGEYMSSEGEFYPAESSDSILMNRKELTTPIRFEGEGATFYYGSADKAVKFTSTADGIRVTHTYGAEETELVMLNQSNVGVDVTKRAFDLKLKTTVVNANDVKLGISVNGMHRDFEIKEAATLLTAQVGVQCENGSAVVLGTLAQHQPKKEFHCLDEGTYVKSMTTGVQRLSLNGIAKDNFTLNTSGVYRIAITTDDQVDRSEVVTYRKNDVTGDDTVGVTDLVRMLKIADDVTYAEITVSGLSEAGRQAIGCKDARLWTKAQESAALTNIRKGLLGQ